ncbi:tetratricopeptide repeat-containing sensor histidine kinase [Flagellimonas allohymeniacidonis]|uniref:histidine kinase n=1 Tax=Flagellimonas allohymeniacidonis TaxID=2517819 RepID=A0A4Q8QKJ8_9FLAO|nr:sensor histidine kinase [Allomuricauda hymeniacidonis]TAI49039.1 sensor histidine kinase [Allomuricauda hymeniacidonis]
MKKILNILVLILLCSCNKGQTEVQAPTNPAITQALEQLRIARDSTALSSEQRKEYLNKGLVLLNQFEKDSNYLTNLSQVSLISSRLKDSSLFRQVNLKVQELSNDRNAFRTLGESHWDLGTFLRNNDKKDSAYYHYRAAYNSFSKLPVDSTSQSLKARMLYGMARLQDDFKDYLGAEVNMVKAIKIFDDLGDKRRLYNSYNQLGIISNGQKNRDKALEYYMKAGALIAKLNVPNINRYRWQNQNNIAHVLVKKEKYNQAIVSYKKLLAEETLFRSRPSLYSKALVSQTFAQSKTGVTGQQLNRQYERAIHINDSIGDLDDQGRAKQFYGELLITQGDTLKGLNYIKEARQIAEEMSNNDRSLEVLRSLTNLDKDNAVAYSTAYFDLSEQIKEEERTERDKFARIRLETDEVIEENVILTRQKQIYGGIAIGLLLLGVALFTIISQRISNNRLKFQQKQQESNQEIYNLMLSQQGKFEEGKKLEQKRISEELHDGILGEMLGIRLVLSGLNEKDDESSVEHRGQLIERLRGVEEEIRTISHELSDSSYQKIFNFIVSLEEMIQNIETSSGIGCSFTYDPHLEWDELEGDLKINAYRIVQEALQNSVKHSQSENALVNFEVEENKLKLSISDDGIGFDINKGKRGIGLRNIISRVKKVNGTLNIDSKKGKGTTLVITFPIAYTKRSEPQETAGSSETIKA